MAIEAIFINKVRSFLTTLGIIIGVFSVIVMIGFGQASQAYITDQVKGLGAGVLIVTPGNPKAQSFGPPGVNTTKTLTIDDAESLESISEIRYVSPNAFVQTLVKNENNNIPAIVIGTHPNVQQARGLTIQKGRFFTLQEAKSASKVIVLGYKLAQDLFNKTIHNPLGAKIKIENQRYRVIGILEPQGSGLFGSVDDQAFMPTKTFQQGVRAGKNLNSIFIKVKSEDLLAVTEKKVISRLRFLHKIREDEEDDFKVQTQAELLKTVSVVTQVFTFLLAGIAAISLLVSGIGIMNIMLVSVIERTKEIGLRRAVGATSGDILKQFLTEALLLTFCGAVFGLLLGAGGAYVASLILDGQFDRWKFSLPLGSVSAALGVAVLTGLGFGTYPAWRASRLKPIEALKYEN